MLLKLNANVIEKKELKGRRRDFSNFSNTFLPGSYLTVFEMVRRNYICYPYIANFVHATREELIVKLR